MQNSIELFGPCILTQRWLGGSVTDGMSFSGALSLAGSTERDP